MKWRTPSLAEAVLVALGPLQAAAMLRCDHIQANGHKFDFGKLGGPRSVTTTERMPLVTFNTTYTLDLCAPLKKKSGKADEQCPNGTRVCAIKHRTKDGKQDVEEVIPITGNLRDQGKGDFDTVPTRLKTSESHSDQQKEGLRLVLKGNKYNDEPIQTVIEFLCSDKEGTEGEWKPQDEYERRSLDTFGFQPRQDEGEGDGGDEAPEYGKEYQLKTDDTALIWESFGRENVEGGKTAQVLRLTWHTKYACENAVGGGSEDQASHWGFFTWFIVLVFLGTAAYLIFGSWLNYNRYGARGWDLLPHGDTIRDIPYLLKDWTRRLINTLQGSGSRGGYSAV